VQRVVVATTAEFMSCFKAELFGPAGSGLMAKLFEVLSSILQYQGSLFGFVSYKPFPSSRFVGHPGVVGWWVIRCLSAYSSATRRWTRLAVSTVSTHEALRSANEHCAVFNTFGRSPRNSVHGKQACFRCGR
jgi:hypothetical protein